MSYSKMECLSQIDLCSDTYRFEILLYKYSLTSTERDK